MLCHCSRRLLLLFLMLQFVGSAASQNVQRLRASDTFRDDMFGLSVSISGSEALVGAAQNYHSGSCLCAGAAYVYRNNSGVWTEEQTLTASDANRND